MHIPTSQTSEIEIIEFEKLLTKSLETEHEFDDSKWLFIPDSYLDYRFILGTKGKKPLICIGINPSTAAPDDLDNTLKSVERIAHNSGYDSFIMFNVYAQRATKPGDMDKELNEALHEQNMKAFSYILSLSEQEPHIWAAWGNIIEMRKYLPHCLDDMIKLGALYSAKWFSSGAISKKGHPHHPLYLKKDSPLDLFDIHTYKDHLCELLKGKKS